MVAMAWRKHKGLMWIAVVLAVVVFWLWHGRVYQAADQAPAPAPASPESEFRLQVQPMAAEPYHPQVVVQGQLQAVRQLVVRARVEGTVERVPALGRRMSAGEELLRLSVDDRKASLARAEAERALRVAELAAAERLKRQGLLAETDYLQRKSAATQAEAVLTQARLALDYSRPAAPFAGTVDAHHVEAGDYVKAGDALLHLVDASEMKLMARVPQQQVNGLAPGLPVTAVLLDGRTLEGTLTFVSSAADEDTRSFAVEARFANPQALRLAGVSAELRIALPPRPAHRLSPALLALDERGRPGVHVVDEHNRLQLVPVTLLAITPNALWVDGLPELARVVTRGAGFVAEGETVAVRELAE
ncbi:efflux RND transporter periplasmic adaptor subunit [Oceanimonas sp. CHS3-5]|uniref:efflux RND transporter periplasmic adaptor subunit n=1 Tax=Oceanimonas sp. CHS3-5 TaxID=3068186 RepID=UPI00273F6D74|nr:efflux RND transporter periplasmic adaptor subunit [Oceanimonas sp. CHS3-5]MDP5291467.1 efflux RND transporter periplasmic adaptor subunit [Oceanimonas sp. CHS3-5]